MATIKIDPIPCKTTGGFDAEITGIDPTDHDCLKGTINTPGAGTINGKWNLGGTCRDNDSKCDLDPRQDEVADAIGTARKVGAPD